MIKGIDFVHNFNGGMLNDDDTWLDLKGAMRDDRMVVYCVLLSFKSDSQLSSSSSSRVKFTTGSNKKDSIPGFYLDIILYSLKLNILWYH